MQKTITTVTSLAAIAIACVSIPPSVRLYQYRRAIDVEVQQQIVANDRVDREIRGWRVRIARARREDMMVMCSMLERMYDVSHFARAYAMRHHERVVVDEPVHAYQMRACQWAYVFQPVIDADRHANGAP